MFRAIRSTLLLPAENKETESGAEQDRQAQPHVVRHEDQHEEVGQQELHGVQDCLDQVHGPGHAAGPAGEQNSRVCVAFSAQNLLKFSFSSGGVLT